MNIDQNSIPQWITKGKTIREIIEELSRFEDQDQKVRLSLDGRVTHYPISILSRHEGYCPLENSEYTSQRGLIRIATSCFILWPRPKPCEIKLTDTLKRLPQGPKGNDDRDKKDAQSGLENYCSCLGCGYSF
jgi:hypothetical protein